MPILWRYLLLQYFKVLILTVFAIIAVLMVTRLDEVAEFAVFGATGKHVLLYALYQIPYILPIALPIACLVSSVLLYQRLSYTHEITALRAAGMPFTHILMPVLLAGAFLSLLDLYVLSEVATESHRATRRMEHEIKTLSPMVLLQHKQLLRHKGAHLDVLGEHHNDRATDVFVALPSRSQERTQLLVVKELAMKETSLTTSDLSILSSFPSAEEQSFDHLMIENIAESHTPSEVFTQHLKKEGWRLNRDHLNMPLLIVRLKHELDDYQSALKRGDPIETVLPLKKQVTRCYTEIVRRLSLGFAVFAFTLMGCAFGIDISRNHTKKGVVTVVGLAAVYLTCFFMAKANESHFFLASTLLLLPHLLIMMASFWTLRRSSLGIEG